jgi:ATP:ADP antiporter, AAA family
MVSSILKKWYGDFSKEELRKYLFLGVIFSLIIGTYWTLRPMKDSLFGALVVGLGKGEGKEANAMFLALAKVVSMCILFPIVIFYSKLVDTFKDNKQKFFYILGLTYAILTLVFALTFAHPTIGLANTVASKWRILGWCWYVFVESYGSLLVALFWAFVTDISTSQSAKRGFSLIVMIGQIGGIAMPQLTKLPNQAWFSNIFGSTSASVVGICAAATAAFVLLFWWFVKTTPQSQLQGYKVVEEKDEQHNEPGFFEGLTLLLSHGYLIGIFAVLSFFELISTFIDFNFKTLVYAQATSDVGASMALGDYGSLVNLVAFICLALGINNIQRWLGIKVALALVPVALGSAVLAFFLWPESLHVLFALMVGAKALNYSLNGPTIKQLYVPTSDDVKYKSQAWIETFGSRGAKASSSFINMTRASLGATKYFALTSGLSVVMLVVWFFTALFLANKCNKAIEDKTVVC